MNTHSTTNKITESSASNVVDTPIYSADGKKTGTIALPESIFGVSWNDALMHQAVTTIQDNARTPVAHTKMRGDVRGGGKKPWQQKGTGRARHGSIRSPIWRGGGVTHGPRNEKNYSRTLPRGMRSRALAMALSRKFKNGEIVFVNSFGIDAPKTAVAHKMLGSLAHALKMETLVTKPKNAALIAFSDPTEAATKSFRNIANVSYAHVRDLNPLAVLRHRYLIIENPEAAVMILSHRLAKKARLSAAKAGSKKTEDTTKLTAKKRVAKKRVARKTT